jgi:ABC-type Mn2+/Zn2+ transport system ATPase subunit
MERVTCAYGRTAVLRDVDLAIGPAQFSGIVGPSGSGKSTLLRVLLGMVRPVAGSVWRRPGLRVGYVPQVETVNWSFPITVSECVLMARTSGRVLPWRSRAERAEVAEVLDRLGIGSLSHRHIRELSGGEQQRVFIARALLGRPQMHLLDDLHHDGLSIVLTTHDLNGIAAHLPHLVCLNTEVIGQGHPREVLTPAVLERTYGAPMEILEHAGMPIVLDRYVHGDVVDLRRTWA